MPVSRPAVLVVDPDDSRRRELARGLAAYDYETPAALAGGF